MSVTQQIGQSDEITRKENDLEDGDIINTIQKHKHHLSIKCLKKKYPNPACFTVYQVNEETVYQVLKTINGKKTTGYDNIPSSFYQDSRERYSLPT